MRISDWSSDVCSSDLQHCGRSVRISGSPRISFEMRVEKFGQLWFDALEQAIRKTPAEPLDPTGFGVDQPLQTDSPLAGEACDKMFGSSLDRFIRRARSEERRVGKECGRTCNSWWSTVH